MSLGVGGSVFFGSRVEVEVIGMAAVRAFVDAVEEERDVQRGRRLYDLERN